MILIAPLTVSAAALFKAVRLRALQDTPKAFGSTYAREVLFSGAEWEDRVRKWTDERSAACFLALDGEEACGIAGGLLDSRDPTQAHLISMWVAPTHRGRGIGHRLVTAVLEWAVSREAHTLRLWVVSDNDRAIGFYQRLGFTATGETETYPNDPALVEIAMSRRVPQATLTNQDKRGATPCSDS